MDAGNMLKPMLARGELRVVGATTLDEYRKHIEKDAALERRFQPVYVGEPSVESTIAILRGLKERYEAHHGVRITDGAIVAAATLSNRYIGDRFLPDKAIDLIDEAASRLRIEIDSMPQEIDEVERRIVQLEIERQALQKEKDPASVERREIDRARAGGAAREVDRHEGAVAAARRRRSAPSAGSSRRSSRRASRRSRRRAPATSARPPRSRTATIPQLEQQMKEAEQQLASKQAGGRSSSRRK